MKKFCAILVILGTALAVNAQSDQPVKRIPTLGAGLVAGLPANDISSYSLAEGVDMLAAFPLTGRTSLTLSAGYIHFDHFGSKTEGGSTAGALIPVMAGVRYQIYKRIYCSGQAGVSFSTIHSRGPAFTYAPGIAYQVTRRFDLLLKYQAAVQKTTVSFVGIRAGFTF